MDDALIDLLLIVLFVCAATDLGLRLIPDVVTVPTIIIAIFALGPLAALQAGLAAIPILTAAVLLSYPHLSKIGGGDFKLIAMIGAILGIWAALAIQSGACLAAVGYGRLSGAKTIPLAPFVLVATGFWLWFKPF